MKAVIARSDIVTGYGWGIEPVWDGLLSGKTAVTAAPPFSSQSPACKVALVPDLVISPGESRARAMLDRLLEPLAGKLDPSTTLILATTVCEIEFVEQSVFGNKAELAGKASPAFLLAHLQRRLGLTGPAMVMSSACASSSAAIARAAAMIELGLAKAALVVTCDGVSEFVYSGFSTLLSLCDSPARPFDANRCGLSLGEAAGWALIAGADSPQANEDAVRIVGWGNTSDAVHMTAPDRLGGGLSRAIASALAMAELPPEQIEFIAAHGTATVYNDAMEMLAFQQSVHKPVPIFSIKGGTGHTLATAGLAQILVSARAMKLKQVPPTVGLSMPDPLALGWARPAPVCIEAGAIALSTNSGFGGVNTAIVLGLGKSKGRKVAANAAAPVVQALGWVCREGSGSVGARGVDRHIHFTDLSSNQQITELVGKPIKYLPRMTREARCALVAVSLAMKAVGGWDNREMHLGIVGSGYQGCLAADREYFRDYVAGGQSLGRANLFIYTLPTSALSEVAIALGLLGPTLHVEANANVQYLLIEQGRLMVRTGEAGGMLCVYSDGMSAVCFAVGYGETATGLADFESDESPSDLCRRLAGMARES